MNIYDLYDNLSRIGGLKIATNITGKGYEFPFVALSTSGAFVILEEGDIHDKVKEIRDMLYPFQTLLSLSAHKVFVYSYNEDNDSWTFLNPYTDEVEDVDAFESIKAQIDSGIYYIDENRLDYMYNKLSFSTTGSQNIKQMPDGQTYVKKNGHWYPASTEDTDYVFRQTCLFGLFGWFQSHKGKKMAAFGYILTCGLFGVGWIFDVLSFLVNAARDEEGCYYLPLTDKKKGWLMFLGVVAAAIGALFLYRFILMFIISGLSKIAGTINQKDLETAVDTLAKN